MTAAPLPSADAVAAPGARGGRFLFLAVVMSWMVWWPAAAVAGTLGHAFVNAAILAGTACVPLAAFALLVLRDTAAQRADYWRGVCAVRGRLPAFAVAAFLMPLLAFAVAAADAVAGGHSLQAGALAGAGLAPLLYLKTFAFGVVVGPVLEELGWRGYALSPLQERCGARRGALVLASVHALWHVPLFFIAGSAQQKLGFLTPDFWRFLADVMVFDVIAAALYVRAGRSTLAAIVFHAAFNASALLFVLSPAAAWTRDLLAGALCMLALARAFPALSEPTTATCG